MKISDLHFSKITDFNKTNCLIYLRFAIMFAFLAGSLLTETSTAAEIRRFTSTHPSTGDCFGCAVAISGNTIAIGESGGSINNQQTGRGVVNIYVRDGNNWVLQQKIQPGDAQADDGFGTSVDLQGDTLVVGSSRDDQTANDNRGSVYVYVRSGTTWTEQTRISPNDLANLAEFGTSVSLSGETLVVGAPGQFGSITGLVGKVYVFVRTGTTWSEQAQINPSDGAADDKFGYSVDISADTIIVGSPIDTTTVGNTTGSAYIYVRSGTNWTFQTKLLGALLGIGDAMGTAVGIDGDTAVVSTPQDDVVNVGIDAGSAYIFIRNGTTWSEQQKIIASNARANARFGNSVAIKGDDVVIGSIAFQPRGLSYLYRRVGSQWRKRQIVSSATSLSVGVGRSVALSDEFILSGAPGGIPGPGGNALLHFLDKKTSTNFDFEGDGVSDISVFRPSTGTWFINRSANNTLSAAEWGINSDIPVSADFDGDGRTDIAVWRADAFADFYILNSSDSTVRIEQFGQTGDVPSAVGDWDGDGKADLAVYRNAAFGHQSYFFYRGSLNNPNGNITYLAWGSDGDEITPGDFDGDTKQDAAVFRPADNTWYIRHSSTGNLQAVQFGLTSDIKVSGDFDGDGKTDPAVYRDGLWIVLRSSDNQIEYTQFGLPADTIVPADYDGDGQTDFAVYRNGTWWLQQSTAGFRRFQFGLATDIPVPSTLQP